MAGHLTGYSGKITATDLKQEQYKNYTADEIIGIKGLEYQYENTLKQKTGTKINIIDASGNTKKVLLEKKAEDGKNVKLTIDVDIQQALYNQLSKENGVGIALNPSTGEVLGLISTPSYDPQTKNTTYNKFRSTYSPGSTFKVVTAAIGLNTKKLDPNEDKKIVGSTWQRDNWGDFYVKRIHPYSPPSNLRKAFIYSDNIYFAQTALSIGKTLLTQESKNFGIGEEFPFDIPLASNSQLCNKAGITSEAHLANTGFGQGEILMNPIHLSFIYTYLLNDGNILKPKLIYEDNVQPEIYKSNVCSKENSALILKYLGEVVSDTKGTAHDTYIAGKSIAGKTGTAELKAAKDAEGSDNGWFIGMDTKNKDLEVCIFIEGVEDKGGSSYAVKKAKNIFKEFIK
jgi:penicillin-binding protein